MLVLNFLVYQIFSKHIKYLQFDKYVDFMIKVIMKQNCNGPPKSSDLGFRGRFFPIETFNP